MGIPGCPNFLRILFVSGFSPPERISIIVSCYPSVTFLLPQRLVLPSRGEPHRRHIHLWEFGQQRFQLAGECGVGVDGGQQITDDAEDIIDARVAAGGCDERIRSIAIWKHIIIAEKTTTGI